MPTDARRFPSVLVVAAAAVFALLPALLRAGSAPAPVPVSFGPNIDLSSMNYSPGAIQRETTVAANPRNPLNIVAGNHDKVPTPNEITNSFTFSMDGGLTWTFGGSVPLVPPPSVAGDPALAADADGNFYYSYLTDSTTQGAGFIITTYLVVAKSTDGGRTFPSFSVVHQSGSTATGSFSPDKDYIGVDAWATSPFKGTIYVGWTETICDPTGCQFQIQVAVSRDKGETWSSPIGVSQSAPADTEGLFGALPVVAPDGAVYVFYADFLAHTGPTRIMFSKSTDGGLSWSPPSPVASRLPSPGLILLKNADPNYGVKPLLGILANSFPTAAIAANGMIFVAWTDVPNGSCHDIGSGSGYVPCTNVDVRLSVSKNGGKIWTAPVKVSDETNATDQFFPWIATHPNGLLSLAWNDKRLDPNNINYDEFYTNTFDGSTFLPNVRVTTSTALSGNEQTPIQDYNGLAVTADGIFPVWAQMTSANADIFTAVGHFVK